MVMNKADLEPADQVLPWEGACSACPCWCAGEWAGTGRLWMLRGSWCGWWSAWDDTKCWPNGTDTCGTQQIKKYTSEIFDFHSSGAEDSSP